MRAAFPKLVNYKKFFEEKLAIFCDLLRGNGRIIVFLFKKLSRFHLSIRKTFKKKYRTEGAKSNLVNELSCINRRLAYLVSWDHPFAAKIRSTGSD